MKPQGGAMAGIPARAAGATGVRRVKKRPGQPGRWRDRGLARGDRRRGLMRRGTEEQVPTSSI